MNIDSVKRPLEFKLSKVKISLAVFGSDTLLSVFLGAFSPFNVDLVRPFNSVRKDVYLVAAHLDKPRRDCSKTVFCITFKGPEGRLATRLV